MKKMESEERIWRIAKSLIEITGMGFERLDIQHIKTQYNDFSCGDLFLTDGRVILIRQDGSFEWRESA